MHLLKNTAEASTCKSNKKNCEYTGDVLVEIATNSDGTYEFSATASASGHSSGSWTATYAFDHTLPSVPAITSISYAKRGKNKGVSLSWSASTDNLSGVAGDTVYRNGTALLSTTSRSWRDPNGVAGMSYQVSASDTAGNESNKSVPAIP